MKPQNSGSSLYLVWTSYAVWVFIYKLNLETALEPKFLAIIVPLG